MRGRRLAGQKARRCPAGGVGLGRERKLDALVDSLAALGLRFQRMHATAQELAARRGTSVTEAERQALGAELYDDAGLARQSPW